MGYYRPMSNALKKEAMPEPLSISGPVCVQDAGKKGRGVFATHAIKEGSLIERCPVVIVPVEQKDLIDKSSLYYYYYAWTPDEEGIALSMGYGSIYNHSFKPNAIFDRVFEGGYIDYIALRNIEAGEEITVNYNGEPDDQDPLPYLTVEE